MTIGIEDYIKANKKLAREEELERNGGRWVAKDRPHKNLKRYDRKRDKKNYNSFLSLSFYYIGGWFYNTREKNYLLDYQIVSLKIIV